MTSASTQLPDRKSGSQFRLVIFDCDGVLVDSEPIANRVFAEMLRELGLPVTLEYMYENFVGRSMKACLQIVHDMLGNSPPEDFADRYHERSRTALRDEVVEVEGIRDVVERLQIPYCVASSGDHEKMRTTLGVTGLLPFFEGKLVSATEVARGKPFPDVFLHAAARFGTDPADCVVIEDSVPGVQAAAAAGMTVYGYAKLTSAARLTAAGAALTFGDMHALSVLLTKRPQIPVTRTALS